MELRSKIKHYVQRKLIKKIINSLSNWSPKNIIRLARLIERIAPGKIHRIIVRSVRERLERSHTHLIYVQKFLRELHPNCRDKLMANLIVNGFIINEGKRLNILKELGMIPPITVLISPTMKCNISCKGCYASAYKKEDDMDFAVADKIVKEAKELATGFITIVGGEPFIWKDLFRLFETHNDCYFQVYTNGTMINHDTVKHLSQVGNVILQMSLEGYEGETDHRREKGIYEKVMNSMDLLREGGVPFGYSVYVTTRNVEVVTSEQFVDFMIEKGAYIGWYFFSMPVGRHPDAGLMPTAEQRNHVRLTINRLRKTKPLFFIDFLNDSPYVNGCIAGGRGFLHINSKGDVEPCVFCHFATDNIKKKSLKEILVSPFFKEIRCRQPFNENRILPCMLIDNPQAFRDIYEKIHPYPTHEGAESLVTDSILIKKIDDYSGNLRPLFIKAWEENSEKLKRLCFFGKGLHK